MGGARRPARRSTPLATALGPREAAGERFDATREPPRPRDARDGVADAAVGVAQKLSKPRLQASPPVGVLRLAADRAALIVAAQGGREVLAVSIYAFSLSALLGTSALYHRVTWNEGQRRWMRRLDHTMIFVLIAGTYTPFALLVMEGTSPRSS